jgi:hypothetical protein
MIGGMANTTHYQCVTAVYDAVVALSLSGVATTATRKVTLARGLTLPAVVVSPGPFELVADSTNERDSIGYPVLVTFIRASDQEATLDAGFQTYLEWRKAVRLAFHNKRITITDGTVLRCLVEPAAILDLAAWQTENLDVGQLLIRVYCRETRS